MTLEELKSKMEPMRLYPFGSKKTIDDDPEACALYGGRCRVNKDGELECHIVITNAEWPDDGKRPNARCFTIKTDEELEPWEFDLE